MRTTVTNPNPKLKTVAVVPFFNLSQEPDVDGRRFALAYYAELQKVPGFQVLPLGVSEVAMVEHQLQMNNPDDVLKLAEALNVDAVVIGAITDYSPYYPPRIGMQVSWYSPHSQEFTPGLPLLTEERHAKKSFLNQIFKSDRLAAKEARHEEHQMKKEIRHAAHEERKAERHEQKLERKLQKQDCPQGDCPTKMVPGTVPVTTPEATVIRGQSVETLDAWPYPKNENTIIQAYAQANQGSQSINPVTQTPLTAPLPAPPAKQPMVAPKPTLPPPTSSQPTETTPSYTKQLSTYCPPTSAPTHTTTLDPRQPFMSYTRLFDGSDAALVAHLRDYLEVSGDRRSGGWEAYLHRSEDFIRFTSHLMILEMLTLHGGQAQHQLIFKVRKYR